MLTFERLSGASGEADVRINPLSCSSLVAAARARGSLDSAGTREDLARLFAQETGVRLLGQRLREEAASGRDPGPRGSLVKLGRSQLAELEARVGAEVLGGEVAGTDADGDAQDAIIAIIRSLESSIAGGTDQIQLNIIGERLLGLDREPREDRGVPFDRLHTRASVPGGENG